MFVDVPEAELRAYRSSVTEPAGFAEFWDGTLAEARAAGGGVRLEPVDTGLVTVDVFDVTFPGFAGEPVRAWLRLPAAALRPAGEPLAAVVEFVGYGGGRGEPQENLLWASAGFAHLHVDTRGQGATWSRGDTPDSGTWGPQVPGVMTRGILAPETYYYRRLFTDAARAVDAARSLDVVDARRVAVHGGSQGGGTAIAAASLVPDVAALSAKVPFLCDFPRAVTITDAHPFREVTDYLATHRDKVERVLHTLAHVDGVNHARRASAPARFTVGLMDAVVPPSTVFAAFNAYAGEKEIAVWPYNGHEGGAADDDAAALVFLRKHLGDPRG
ncbi:acetylxylan esterase [Kineococcus glutinatus]|uniref:acetylxylan esterase n=1 Tax=Kineococcus glutinatus TaxID=1070872 RepID=UPI0031F0EC86